jgi:hypothetical protein
MIHTTPDPTNQVSIRWKVMLSGSEVPKDFLRAMNVKALRPTWMAT